MATANDGIRRQIENSKQKIKDLQAEVELEKLVIQRLSLVLDSLGDDDPEPSESQSNIESTAKRGTLEYHIFEILKARGAMSVSKITEILLAKGVSTKAAKGLKPSVASTLSRKSDVFENVARGVYRLNSKLFDD